MKMLLKWDGLMTSGCIPPLLIFSTLVGSVGMVAFIWYQAKRAEQAERMRELGVEEGAEEGAEVVQQQLVAEPQPETDDMLLHFANRPETFAAIVGFHRAGRFPLNTRNECGHSLVMVCAALNLVGPMRWLVSEGAELERLDWTAQTLKKCESALWLAARCGHLEILEMILGSDLRRTSLELPNESGATPLMAAVMARSAECLRALLGAGANANAAKLDRMTPLMVAVTLGRRELVELLLGAPDVQLDLQDRFGMTALMHACYRGQAALVELLLDRGADLGLTDNDQMSCLHHACKEAPKPSWPCALEDVDHPATLSLLLRRGADLRALDSGGASALHVAACRIAAHSEELAGILLDGGVDVAQESLSGWTALHTACDPRLGNPAVRRAIEGWAERHAPGFLAGFDAGKPRSFAERQRKPQEQPRVTCERLLEGLREGRFKSVVVLSGAGMSVAAGIPAFRTPGGLYDQTSAFSGAQKTRPASIFQPEVFQTDPACFYDFVRRVFLHKSPTASHRFVGALHRSGILRRWYSQNIDGLEHQVGVPSDLVVESHGTLMAGRCQVCKVSPFSSKNDLLQARYLDALTASPSLPLCPYCSCVLRPAVTFFGEPMNERFVRLRPSDLQACDLLIVIGTSLTVYPFAALVSDVGSTVPRLLINCDAVGPWSAAQVSPRDLFLQGCCDDVISQVFAPVIDASTSHSST